MDLQLNDPANVGGRIKHLRELRGMSQTQLAKAALMEQPSLSDIEKGKSKSPNAANLLRIAAVLGANPWWLVSGEQDPFGDLSDVEEAEMLRAFRLLNDPAKRRVILAATKALSDETTPQSDQL